MTTVGLVMASAVGFVGILPAGASATVTVQRGDITATAGGVGHIVDAGAPASAPPTAAGMRSGGASSGGSTGSGAVAGQGVVPQASGVVARVLVSPGDHVVSGQALVVLDDGGTSALNVTLAQNDLRTAQLEAEQQRTAGASATELAIALSRIDSAGARLLLEQLGVNRLTVRAPRDGTVTAVLTAVGASADSSTPVAAIADLGQLAASLDVNEFDAARVQAGQPATVSVDALGGASFRGIVDVGPLAGVDNGGVVTFPVRVRLVPTPSEIKLGMSVSVHIVVAARRGVMLLPLDAVSRHGHRATVTVVDATGHRAPRTVTLGAADNRNVEVLHGLQVGDRVESRPNGQA